MRQSFNGRSRSQGARGKGRDSQVHDGGNTIACNNSQPQRAFKMAIRNRPSYHGDVRERSASQRQGHSDRGYEGEREKIHENLTIVEGSGTEVCDEHSSDDRLFSREREGSSRRTSGDPRHKVRSGGDQEREEGRGDRHYHSERRVRWEHRVRSESEHQHGHEEEERPPPSQKVSQRSQSFCSRGPSIRARSKHTPRAGNTQSYRLQVPQCSEQADLQLLYSTIPKASPTASLCVHLLFTSFNNQIWENQLLFSLCLRAGPF